MRRVTRVSLFALLALAACGGRENTPDLVGGAGDSDNGGDTSGADTGGSDTDAGDGDGGEGDADADADLVQDCGPSTGEAGDVLLPRCTTLPINEVIDITPQNDQDCYRFTVSAPGGLVATTAPDAGGACPASMDTRLTLFLDDVTLIGDFGTSKDDPCARLEVPIQPNTYRLCVSHPGGLETAGVRLRVDYLTGPANDLCADAVDLGQLGSTGELLASGYSVGAADDRRGSPTCQTASSGHVDVFYKFTTAPDFAAPGVQIDLGQYRRWLRSVVYVFPDCASTQGSADLACAAESEYSQSTTFFDVTPGTTYYIAVDGQGGSAFQAGVFNLKVAPAPALLAGAETCAGAPALPGPSGGLTGDFSTGDDDYDMAALTFCGRDVDTHGLDKVYKFSLDSGKSINLRFDAWDHSVDEVPYILQGPQCPIAPASVDCWPGDNEGNIGWPPGEIFGLTNDTGQAQDYYLVLDEATDETGDLGQGGKYLLRWVISDCQPNCQGRECGPDGCGGSCGTCPSEARLCTPGGVCDYCDPVANCAGKECGPSGCVNYNSNGTTYSIDCGYCTTSCVTATQLCSVPPDGELGSPCNDFSTCDSRMCNRDAAGQNGVCASCIDSTADCVDGPIQKCCGMIPSCPTCQ